MSYQMQWFLQRMYLILTRMHTRLHSTAASSAVTNGKSTHLMLVMAEETRNSAQTGIIEVRIIVLEM